MPRSDGTPVKRMPALRRFMPYLMPNRNQAAVYFEQTLEIDHTLDWCEERGVKLFDVILAALVRVFAEREQIHRFVAAGRLWQRKHIELAFAVKKVFEEKAPITTMKVRFEPEDDIDAVRGRVRAAIGAHRGFALDATKQVQEAFVAALEEMSDAERAAYFEQYEALRAERRKKKR